ncbi:MAG: tyrosine-type recombinase/integrase [Acidimicrobiales bacterium]
MTAAEAFDHDQGGLLAALFAAVRPQFGGEIIRVDPDDPVFGRGRCGVAGCDRTAWTRQVCTGHYQRWCHHGKTDIDRFRATTGPIAERPGSEMVDAFDLSGLATQPRLEVAYVLQSRHDDRRVRVPPSTIRHLVGLLTDSGVASLLDRPLDDWLAAIAARGWRDPSRTIALLRYAHRHLTDLGGIDLETEYASDLWVAARLGIRVARSPRQIRFDTITQPWLRAAVKRWARLRLGSGKTFGTVHVDARAMVWFSRFLATHDPDAGDASTITRDALEGYLVWLTASHLVAHTTSTYITCLRSFLDTVRRHHWLPALAPTAALYNDDLPRRPRPLPRFIPEFVMNQLENPDNLAVLPDPTTRALVVVLVETGLRANDACALPFNPVIDDSAGWPCLRYFNAKMATEQLVPLSAKAAETIRAQQAHLRQTWPDGPAVLFPAPHSNPDGARPFNYATLRQRLARWQDDIDVSDHAGQRVRATAHQFRHTLGTRLINQGVPQHVVQRLLGHASPQMTARYATLHDTTVRQAFDDYCQRRVNIAGKRVDYDPAALTADAEWTKHNLARVQASLPNGYCGRPPQQDCPHPNACLTCPDFQTTPAYLDVHRRQRDETRVLIASAEADGRFRLAANHRQVQDNLERVIAALDAIGED